MAVTLTFGGVVQVHLQRVMGMTYMEVQEQLALFYWMRLGAGAFVMLGALLYVWAVLGPIREDRPARLDASESPPRPVPAE